MKNTEVTPQLIKAIQSKLIDLVFASPKFPQGSKVAIYLPTVGRLRLVGMTANQIALALLINAETARELLKEADQLKEVHRVEIESYKKDLKELQEFKGEVLAERLEERFYNPKE